MDHDGDARVFPGAPRHDFRVGDVVLAYHGALLYEATILAVGPGAPAKSYRVHYQGWRMSWDDDVPREAVVVHNNDNLRLAHELLGSAKARQERERGLRAESSRSPTRAAAADLADAAPPADPPASSPGADAAPAGADAARAGHPQHHEHEKERQPASALFVMPVPLKRHVVEDHEWIVKERRLVSLPRKPTVYTILSDWQAYCGGGDITDRGTREVAASLIEYFDALLPIMLLYRFERSQFESYFRSHRTGPDGPLRPSNVYGAEHLARLLLKIPSLLDVTELDPQTLKLIANRVNDLMEYIRIHARDLFLPAYEQAPDDYMPFIV